MSSPTFMQTVSSGLCGNSSLRSRNLWNFWLLWLWWRWSQLLKLVEEGDRPHGEGRELQLRLVEGVARQLHVCEEAAHCLLRCGDGVFCGLFSSLGLGQRRLARLALRRGGSHRFLGRRNRCRALGLA